jgi:hypothetical protein
MTLCMAAVCREKGEARIVLCSDNRIETDYAGGNIGFKVSVAGPQLPAMYAGVPTEAEDLLATSREIFDRKPYTRNTVYDILNDVVAAHYEKLHDRYIHRRLGVSHERFLSQGANEVDDQTRSKVFTELSEIDLGCELIVNGFIAGRSEFVFHISKDGSVSRVHDFVAIGTGSLLADAFLFLRRQSHTNTVERTLYNLYEASRLAQIAPGVGETKEFCVLEEPHENGRSMGMRVLIGSAVKSLEDMFKEVGPREIVTDLTLDDDAYNRIVERDEPNA